VRKADEFERALFQNTVIYGRNLSQNFITHNSEQGKPSAVGACELYAVIDTVDSENSGCGIDLSLPLSVRGIYTTLFVNQGTHVCGELDDAAGWLAFRCPS
jgi:hypothetical protein